MNPEPIYDAAASPREAPCPLHPTSPSIATCSRCGSFMCKRCVGLEAGSLCPTCSVQAVTFPMTRSEWSVSALFSLGWESFKPQWLMLSVAFVVFLVAYYGAILLSVIALGIVAGILGEGGWSEGVVPLVELVETVVMMLVSSFLGLGFNRICLDVYEGRPVSIGAIFSQTGQMHLVGKLWATVFAAIGVLMVALAATFSFFGEGAGTVASFVAIIPLAVVMGIGVMLLMVGFVRHPELGFFAHVRRLGAMMRGQILGSIGLMFMGGLAVMAGALMCGIGMIPAYSLYMMLITGLYLALENDPGFRIGRAAGLDTIR